MSTDFRIFFFSWCISTGIMADLKPAAYFKNTVWQTATTTGTLVTVEVDQGTLRGQEKISKFFPDGKYYSFEGIPYAKPPEGLLRFKDPEEPESWSGVRDATGEGEWPMPEAEEQDFTGTVFDQFLQPPDPTDDVLYLDVDTPQVDEIGKPVIVWIHPMRFTEESAYSPQYFGVGHYMAQDVVLVTVRYRHNVLGFLCLDHEEVPGNAGLKDQVMALKWIQRNIARFGGDPNNITLYGFGVAAAFAHYHVMSPLSEGLFHRVIIQGDSALNSHSFIRRKEAIAKAFSLGKELGRDTENTNELLEFLRTVHVIELVEAAKKVLNPLLRLAHFTTAFLPCVEDPVTDKSFLPLLPFDLLNKGRFAKVPIIMGVTDQPDAFNLMSQRGNNEVSEDKENEVSTKNEKLNEMLQEIAKQRGLSLESDEFKKGLEDINKFYFSNTQNKYEMLYSSSKLMNDVSYIMGFDEAVKEQMEHMDEPLYAFQFKLFSTQNPMIPLMYGDTWGLYRPNHVYNTFIKMWTSFAKTGNPNFDGMDTAWEPVGKESFCYLEIGDLLKIIRKRIAEDSLHMWKQIQSTMGEGKT